MSQENTPPSARKWAARERNYSSETSSLSLRLTAVPPTEYDPLLNPPPPPAAPAGKRSSIAGNPASPLDNSSAASPTPAKPQPKVAIEDDPLAGDDPLSDPLSDATAQLAASSISGSDLSSLQSSTSAAASSPAVLAAAAAVGALAIDDEERKQPFVPWGARKAGIISKYTTMVQLSIPSIQTDIQKTVGSAAGSSTQSRLEQIGADEIGDEEQQVRGTQKEYVSRMNETNEELKEAWAQEQRVRALKMAIACAKMLGDASVPHFYPTAFVLATEILDTFGDLVFERIKSKGMVSVEATKKKPLDITPEDVLDESRETCRNWFYKIASIRELLPRIYMEICILKAYQFLYGNTIYEKACVRLAKMMRGIGNPLVAAYARAYLARRGLEVLPANKEYLSICFNDQVAALVVQTKTMDKVLEKIDQQITRESYLDLYSPAWDWLCAVYGRNAGVKLFRSAMKTYCTDGSGFSVLLNAIMSSFPSVHVSAFAEAYPNLIRETTDEIVPRSQLFASLGVVCCDSSPVVDKILPILNDVWKSVSRVEDCVAYANVAVVWIDYVCKYMNSKEVNMLLKDFLRHVSPNRAYEKCQDQIQGMCLKVCSRFQTFAQLVTMDFFMPVVDLCLGKKKVTVCKAMLELFARNTSVTSDAIVIQTAFDAGKALHDSIDAMSFEDEVRQISRLLCIFIRGVSFSSDLELHLNFFVDCRRFFIRIDDVKFVLVMGVLSLVQRTNAIVKGNHTRRTTVFVKACLAYAHITIPSIMDPMRRLHLFLLAGQISLSNNLVTQAETLLKAAIAYIPDLSSLEPLRKPHDDDVMSFISSLANTLIVAPGHPEYGPLYLVKGLINVSKEYPWAASHPGKFRSYLAILQCLSALSQDALPFHACDAVQSNDVLFVGDDEYANETAELISKLLEEIVLELAAVKNSDMALHLAVAMLQHASISSHCAGLVYDLFKVAKNQNAPSSQLQATVKMLAGLIKRGVHREREGALCALFDLWLQR